MNPENLHLSIEKYTSKRNKDQSQSLGPDGQKARLR